MGFLLLELVNAVFDRSGTDEFVDEDRLVLADAVGAVSGLVFGGRIPPGIVVDDAVGGCQIQTGATGFEGDEEDGDVLVLESFDQSTTVLGLTGEL